MQNKKNKLIVEAHFSRETSIKCKAHHKSIGISNTYYSIELYVAIGKDTQMLGKKTQILA